MNKSLPKIFLSVKFLSLVVFFLCVLSFYLFFSLTPSAYAQLSGCGQIQVGNPPANVTPPSQCNSAGDSNSIHWPFKTKDPSQFRRIDQGWDLQPSGPSPVFAVASGTVSKANNDPCGFGNNYPILHLDTPVVIGGRKYTDIYYGHVHYQNGVLGQHIDAGKQIAYTYSSTDCSPPAWPNPWLEIGFGTSVPVGQGSFPTTAGLDMEQYLNGTRRTY